MSTLSRNMLIAIVSISVVCIVVICCIGLFLFNPTGSSTPTPTTTTDISVIIMQTSDAALIQTQLASSPTSYSTSTNLPTLTPAATLAVIDTLQPPAIILPFDRPTATTFILPTDPPVSGSACSCTGDLYNCTTDFSTHAQAQACFEYCIAQGVGDIHQLDGNDHDGLACESLP